MIRNRISAKSLKSRRLIGSVIIAFRSDREGNKIVYELEMKDAANQLLRYRHDPAKKKSFWEKLKDALVPGYGHWCGPGIGQGANEARTGINGVDEKACRPHDGRYNTPGYNRLTADEELFGNLLTHFPGIQISDPAFGSGPSIGSKYKFGALPLFGVILPGFRFITGSLNEHICVEA
jgi:hypothetical protein